MRTYKLVITRYQTTNVFIAYQSGRFYFPIMSVTSDNTPDEIIILDVLKTSFGLFLKSPEIVIQDNIINIYTNANVNVEPMIGVTLLEIEKDVVSSLINDGTFPSNARLKAKLKTVSTVEALSEHCNKQKIKMIWGVGPNFVEFEKIYPRCTEPVEILRRFEADVLGRVSGTFTLTTDVECNGNTYSSKLQRDNT